MIVYNVTLSLDPEIQEEWIDWMKSHHIPEVMATGMFLDYQLCRVISHQEEGITYAVQYRCKDMKTLHQYQAHHAPALQKDHNDKYHNKVIAFRTLLEVVDHNQNG